VDPFAGEIEIPDAVADTAGGDQESLVLLFDFILMGPQLVDFTEAGLDETEASLHEVLVERQHDEIVDAELEDIHPEIGFSRWDKRQDRALTRAI
jgi:hypothetical protein